MMRAVLVALGLVLVSCARPPTVEVGGERLVGKHDGSSIAFLGVPYAEPPVRDLRWRAPREPGYWEGTREASGATRSIAPG